MSAAHLPVDYAQEYIDAPFALVIDHEIVSSHTSLNAAKAAHRRAGGVGEVVDLAAFPGSSLAASRTEAPEAPAAPEAAGSGNLRLIPCGRIQASPFNPRQAFDDAALQQLADSLKKHGQLQNCVVRPHGNGDLYELIAGERRWRAATLAGLPGVWCDVRDCSDAEAVELAGLENVRRQQLNVIEEARWYRAMIDIGGHTQGKLAEQVGVTQGLVSQRLRLLDLPDVWQQRIISGLISASWTRCLLPWLERPAVLERASEAMKTIGGNRDVSERDVEQSVYNAVTELSRPLRGGF